MRTLKHLPLLEWPAEDHAAFAVAFAEGDIFDETNGPGAHLSERTRRSLLLAWRRWLAYLKEHDPETLELPPADRVTRERVQRFVEHLRAQPKMKLTSVGSYTAHLYSCARLLGPERDWGWLRTIVRRLHAAATPIDRFDRLVPPPDLLSFAFELMDSAMRLPRDARHHREIQYRDGLMIAVVSYWPIRRRSLAALTLSEHLELEGNRADLLLRPQDTKQRRAESWAVPDELRPYLLRYLREIRSLFPGANDHDGLWPSCKGQPLSESQIYVRLTKRVHERFGKKMSLHDFRRSAATFLAMEAPEKVGIIPGILQHTSPDIGDRHYKLSRSVNASRRFGDVLAAERARLRRLVADGS